MERSLSPRDAADKLGITPDTLRRWERSGLVKSERTPGGQRRYREDEILSLLDSEPSEVAKSEPSAVPLPPQREATGDSSGRSPSISIPPWERRVHEEQAELEVLKLRRERAALVRTERAEREAREFDSAEKQRQIVERDRERKRIVERQAAERARLENLRSYGRLQAILAPPEWQAKVARDLEVSVTSERYPIALSDYLARSQVSERVEEVLRPWRDSVTAERSKLEEQSKRSSLMFTGRWYAHSQMRDWDVRDKGRAERQIEREMTTEIEADWSDDDVRDLIDEILEEWE